MIDLHDYWSRVEKTVTDPRHEIALTESGQIKMNSKTGGEAWRDANTRINDRNRRIISTYELILADIENRLKGDVH